MKAVPVKGGYIAIVDDEDFERVSQHQWTYLRAARSLTVYARTSIDGRTVYMHRMVKRPPDDMEVNHEDGDGMNNRKANLTVCTHQDNMVFYHARVAYDRWKAGQKVT